MFVEIDKEIEIKGKYKRYCKIGDVLKLPEYLIEFGYCSDDSNITITKRKKRGELI